MLGRGISIKYARQLSLAGKNSQEWNYLIDLINEQIENLAKRGNDLLIFNCSGNLTGPVTVTIGRTDVKCNFDIVNFINTVFPEYTLQISDNRDRWTLSWE